MKAGEVPEHLHPPELLPGMESWLSAFYELSSDRQIGMGVGQLPAASIERHTSGWLVDDAWVFRVVMRALDEVYLEHQGAGGKKPVEIADGGDRLEAIFGGLLGT